MTDPAAEVIADEHLHATGRALHSGCFDHMKVHVQLPLVLETEHHTRVLRHECDLHRLFKDVRADMRKNGIHELVRSVVEAEFINSDTVGSTHVSRPIRADGEAVGPPYPSYSVLCRTPDGWKLARTCVALRENRFFGDSILAFDTTER